MAQWFRILAALPEDLGSILSTYMAAHSLLSLQTDRIQCPLLDCLGTRHTSGAQTQLQARHPYTENK